MSRELAFHCWNRILLQDVKKLACASVIIGRPSVIPSKATLETLRDWTWYRWCQKQLDRVTTLSMKMWFSFSFSSRLREVLNSHGVLRLRWIKAKTWGAFFRQTSWGTGERFEDRVTRRIVYFPRLVKTTNCSLRARLLRCAFALANELKLDFLSRRIDIYRNEMRRVINVNASSLNLIFCTVSRHSYDETIILRANRYRVLGEQYRKRKKDLIDAKTSASFHTRNSQAYSRRTFGNVRFHERESVFRRHNPW